MKKLFPLLILIASCHFLNAQTGWQELGTGGNALNANCSIYSICSDSGGVVYTSGCFTDSLSVLNGITYVAKWNPLPGNWSVLGESSWLNAGVSICVDQAHNVYAASNDTDSTGKYYVAKWDYMLNSWSKLGTGTSSINANNSIVTLCTDKYGNVYAAGNFTDINGNYYVAKWDGTNWSELGTGIYSSSPSGFIMAITSDTFGNIYAGGNFRENDSLGGKLYVAKWNGASWIDLGEGTAGALNAINLIQALATDVAGNVYAGGQFTDGSGKFYVAKWDGSAWSELGTLTANGPIYTLCTDKNSNVFAGGYFTNSSGHCYVAKWDGTNWSELGTGVNALNADSVIFTLTSDASGNVYAGGYFTDSIVRTAGHEYVAVYNEIRAGITILTDSKISVYPNPAHAFVNVKIPASDLGDKYTLISDVGQVVNTGTLKNLGNNIDISALPQGLYLLRIGNNPYGLFKIAKE